MALTNRQTIREEVSSIFDGISQLQANYAYPVLNIEGKSPITTLHGDGTVPKMLSKNANEFDHFFKLTVMVNRKAHGAEEAENLLDTVVTAVFQKVRDNPTGSSFMTLVADVRQTAPQFAIIDGHPYRIEEIGLGVRSNISG